MYNIKQGHLALFIRAITCKYSEIKSGRDGEVTYTTNLLVLEGNPIKLRVTFGREGDLIITSVKGGKVMTFSSSILEKNIVVLIDAISSGRPVLKLVR